MLPPLFIWVCKLKFLFSSFKLYCLVFQAPKREDNGQTVDIEAFPNVMHGDAEHPMSTK